MYYRRIAISKVLSIISLTWLLTTMRIRSIILFSDAYICYWIPRSLTSIPTLNVMYKVVRRGLHNTLRILTHKKTGIKLHQQVSKRGWTLLHTAAMFEQPGVVADLIAAGEQLEAKDKEGMTPLLRACSRGSTDTS